MATLKEKIYNKLSYTNQDYDSILRELMNMFNSDESNAISTSWNNFSETDIVYILMSLFAAHKDILNYMIDYRTLESFMSTAKERASIVRIANSFGYKIASYKAGMAEYKLVSVIGDAPGAYIPYGTQFVDNNGTPWVYIDNSKQIGLNESINLYQGILQSININIDNVKNSNKTHILSSPNIAIGSTFKGNRLSQLKLLQGTDTEETFTEVDNLYRYSGTNLNVYELNVDPQELTYIKFHKDCDLAKYSSTDTFVFSYVTTSGDSVSSTSNINSAMLKPTATSTQAYSYRLEPTGKFYKGADRATAAYIKEDFKRYYASSNLLITQNDIKNFILNKQETVQGITKCLVIDNQVDTENYNSRANLLDNGIVKIYALKANNVRLTDYENQLLLEELNKYKMAGINFILNDADLEENKIIINLGFSASSEFKEFLINFINSKNIGTTISAGELNQAISKSRFNDEFNNNNGTIRLNSAGSVLLDYYQYGTCIAENIME